MEEENVNVSINGEANKAIKEMLEKVTSMDAATKKYPTGGPIPPKDYKVSKPTYAHTGDYYYYGDINAAPKKYQPSDDKGYNPLYALENQVASLTAHLAKQQEVLEKLAKLIDPTGSFTN